MICKFCKKALEHPEITGPICFSCFDQEIEYQVKMPPRFKIGTLEITITQMGRCLTPEELLAYYHYAFAAR